VTRGRDSRRGRFLVQRRHQDVRLMIVATSACTAARNGTNSIGQPVGRVLDERQLEMGSRRWVSPWREMLPHAARPSAGAFC